MLIGGIASIWFNFGLPNSEGALRLRRKVAMLCAKNHRRWRRLELAMAALICAKLQGIESDLRSATWFFPSFAGQLKELQDTAAMTEHCDNALNPIKSGLTNTDEVVAMRAELKTAEALLSAQVNRKRIPELEAKIQERETRIKAALAAGTAFTDPFPNDEFKQVLAAMTTAKSDVPLVDYVQRETNSLKLDLAMEAAIRKQALAPKAAAAAVGSTPLLSMPPDYQRLTHGWSRTVDYLRPDNPESLRMAHILILEMHQDIYPNALHQEFAKTDGAEILINITDPKVSQAVRFSIRFRRNVINIAAACKEMVCEWNFGDNSRKEMGWEVFHGFDHEHQTAHSYTISV